MADSDKPAIKPTPKHTVHWFKKCLRIHDNPSLKAGLEGATTFRCVFFLDTTSFDYTDSMNKWRFLLECLADLDESLKTLDSRLFLIRGQPTVLLSRLIAEWGITTLSFDEDPEPYGRFRDNMIINMCRKYGVTVCSRISHTLFNLDKIMERNNGQAPLTYTQFQSIVATMLPPPLPEPAITKGFLKNAKTPLSKNHNDKFGVPKIDELGLGFDTANLKQPVWVGGEKEALARLNRNLEKRSLSATHESHINRTQFLFASDTCLSPYIRFGCLSVTLFYHKLSDLYITVKKKQPPLALYNQILWREFLYCAATRNPNFDCMAGNPICVQIPWHSDSYALAKWANAQTGFPWIDAIMTQLREEGWIDPLARHAVACFLTRGDLWISWENGMRMFEDFLLDADWVVNAGTWMWFSCSAFFQQFLHCCCPVGFGRKLDPDGDYIRYYLPVLKNMPTEYIHKPWVAPESVQKEAGCIIGINYPLPMVDHEKVSQINLQRLKQVYAKLAKFNFQENTVSSNDQPRTDIHQMLMNINSNHETSNAIISMNQERNDPPEPSSSSASKVTDFDIKSNISKSSSLTISSTTSVISYNAASHSSSLSNTNNPNIIKSSSLTISSTTSVIYNAASHSSSLPNTNNLKMQEFKMPAIQDTARCNYTDKNITNLHLPENNSLSQSSIPSTSKRTSVITHNLNNIKKKYDPRFFGK